LEANGLRISDLDSVVYDEKPLLTFERLLEAYLGSDPVGGRSFVAAMPVWLQEKLFIKSEIKKQIKKQIKKIAQDVGGDERPPAAAGAPDPPVASHLGCALADHRSGSGDARCLSRIANGLRLLRGP
jgi:hypothetical protein